MTRYQAALDYAAILMSALPARAQYGKWVWEALKVVGASALATIIAMQISIARHQEQMEVMRKDIEAVSKALAKQSELRDQDNGLMRQKLQDVMQAIHDHEVRTLSDELLRLRNEREGRSMRQP